MGNCVIMRKRPINKVIVFALGFAIYNRVNKANNAVTNRETHIKKLKTLRPFPKKYY